MAQFVAKRPAQKACTEQFLDQLCDRSHDLRSGHPL